MRRRNEPRDSQLAQNQGLLWTINFVQLCVLAFVQLGRPVVPFYLFFWEGSDTRIDYREKLVPLTSLLEDLREASFISDLRPESPLAWEVFRNRLKATRENPTPQNTLAKRTMKQSN